MSMSSPVGYVVIAYDRSIVPDMRAAHNNKKRISLDGTKAMREAPISDVTVFCRRKRNVVLNIADKLNRTVIRDS